MEHAVFAQNEISHAQFLFHNGGVPKILNHVNENVGFDRARYVTTAPWLEKNMFIERPANFDRGVRYRAAMTSEILRALNFVAKKVDTSKAGFFDMGCGKGKPLCIAAEDYNFARVTGVDYYKAFIERAQKNMEVRKIQDRVELYHMDMTEFTDFTETSVVFLYNPADDYILSHVRDNLEKQTQHTILIYNKPVHADVFKNWTVLSEKTNKDPDYCTTIYEFKKK